MARLTRKNIKVFAENATNNGIFGSLQAGNPVTTSNVEQVQSLPAWSTGWNSATMTSEKLPPLEEFQGVQYVTTYQQAYLMQEGIPEWASTVTYYKGCLAKEVTANGFRIYNSLTDNNNNHLLSDTSNWKKVMDSDDLYAFDNNVVHLTGDETIRDVKTFEAKNIFLRDSADDRSSAPSSNRYAGYVIEDVNGERLAIFEKAHHTNGDIDVSMHVCRQGTTGVANQASIRITYPSTGDPYATCPTPTDTTQTNSYQIDTVGARNTRINDVLAALYPVGSIYIGTQSTCPLATLISGSTWTKISGDRVLQSSSSSHAANTTIAAGLPNIKGSTVVPDDANISGATSGAFKIESVRGDEDGYGDEKTYNVSFNASRSSSIYGNSTTVQPPAYVVNVWRRTA